MRTVHDVLYKLVQVSGEYGACYAWTAPTILDHFPEAERKRRIYALFWLLLVSFLSFQGSESQGHARKKRKEKKILTLPTSLITTGFFDLFAAESLPIILSNIRLFLCRKPS